MNEDFQSLAKAYAEANRARHEREADTVTVHLGQGVTWRLSRAAYDRLRRHRRPFRHGAFR